MHPSEFEAAKQSILSMDKEQAIEIDRRLISEGHDPLEIMNNGFIPGIQEVGELFGHGQVFLPELMDEAMPEKQTGKKGTIVIATVKGDVHDIGKRDCNFHTRGPWVECP